MDSVSSVQEHPLVLRFALFEDRHQAGMRIYAGAGRPADVLCPFFAEVFKERGCGAVGIYTDFGSRSGSFRPITATLAGGGVPINRLRGQAEERRKRGAIRCDPFSGGTERTVLSGRDVSFRRPAGLEAHRQSRPYGARFKERVRAAAGPSAEHSFD